MGAGGVRGRKRRAMISRPTVPMVALVLGACHRAASPAAVDHARSDRRGASATVNEIMSSATGGEAKNSWTVPVPGGVLKSHVGRGGSGGAEKYGATGLIASAEQVGDGRADYTISIRNDSPQPSRINWRVDGEGSHPAAAQDFRTLMPLEFPFYILPSGMMVAYAHRAQAMSFWVVQDHSKEPCEGFRVSLSDAVTGRPLRDRGGGLVIAHSAVSERFDPRDPGVPACP